MNTDSKEETPDAQKFRRDLTNLLNFHSAENNSDTADYVLAGFLIASLAAFDAATKRRTAHEGGGYKGPPNSVCEKR